MEIFVRGVLLVMLVGIGENFEWYIDGNFGIMDGKKLNLQL